ncbi:MAG: polysaccharide deacetylase family protein [Hyphomicrobiaceae bacterium]|nr:polysaccharide deacetylase family protein [Hyphomicrobiaceae bacterium]
MSRRSTNLLKYALSALHYSGADSLIAPLTRGVGVIFMLHHVHPDAPAAFAPNRILKITPDFLERTINYVRESGFDIVSLDELHFRLTEGEFERPFAAFTFDDGYRDNLQHAYPVFKRHQLPFTIYVPTDFADGTGDLWWLALEHVIAHVDQLSLVMNGERRTLSCRDPDEKNAAFHRVYWWLRSIDERTARRQVAEMCRSIGFDARKLAADQLMGWDELRILAADPLVTIGGHTRSHFALAKLPLAEARLEMESNIRRLEHELERPCRHFSYPYGCALSADAREFELARELGLKTAVTTRKGLLHARHTDQLTALPRFSLNGDFQDERYLRVLLNGAPFAMLDAVQRTRQLARL